jgi:predicted small lipoprotein YifL
MLRVLLVAAMLAAAYCGAKGPPHPPAAEAPDAGAPPPSDAGAQ